MTLRRRCYHETLAMGLTTKAAEIPSVELPSFRQKQADRVRNALGCAERLGRRCQGGQRLRACATRARARGITLMRYVNVYGRGVAERVLAKRCRLSDATAKCWQQSCFSTHEQHGTGGVADQIYTVARSMFALSRPMSIVPLPPLRSRHSPGGDHGAAFERGVVQARCD